MKPDTQRASDRLRTIPTTDRQQGFALVISLSLMALVLLLLVLLSSQIQINLSEAGLSRSYVQAKESAKLGMLVALGNLQKSAGPDQRVTARADLFFNEDTSYSFAEETVPEHRFWTGVWDTTEESAYEGSSLDPVWLVSGDAPAPSAAINADDVILLPGYNPSGTNGYSDPEAFHPVRAELVELEASQSGFAWWIGDEGTKASIAVQDELVVDLAGLPEDAAYLDYGTYSAQVLSQTSNPTFPYHLLYDYTTASSSDLSAIDSLGYEDDLRLAWAGGTATEEETLEAQSLHDVTPGNLFVLSNPIDGGLKKDLSYLKTLDPETLTEATIESLYGSTAEDLTPEAIEFFHFQGDPASTQPVKGQSLLIPGETLAETRALDSRFTFAPIITEFQLAGGVAAEDGDLSNATVQPSDIYFVYRIYLDIWNPYTVPMRIGDGAGDGETNSWDLRIEIQNLPSGTVTNDDTLDSQSVTLPDISLLWSDWADGKTLRPGMNFEEIFPQNEEGTSGTGVIQVPLNVQLNGSRSHDYTGEFTMGGQPLEITIYAINNSGDEKELCKATIRNYPDFTVNYFYDYSDRSSWFKRKPDSNAGFGMGHDSLEGIGYAFGFRFRLLDEQESLGTVRDLSQLLSETDIRNQVIDVDLATWDINDAWDDDDPLPYDFQTNASDVDPGYFDPNYGFLSSDFFYFQTTGTGRQDRIARIFETPTADISSISALRNIEFADYPSNAIGSPWGEDLNEYYDAFFFSTLPDPAVLPWNGTDPLANPKIQAYGGIPSLTTPATSENLMLENGFNVNSTSTTAWTSILGGPSFAAGTFSFRYEKPHSADWADDPTWETLDDALENVYFTLPYSGPFNLTEQPDDPRYNLITMDSSTDYTGEFSMQNGELNTDRQHPAFIQGLREIEQSDIDSLGEEVVNAIREFAATHNRPPFSMAEFFNEGILQNAIDNVPTLNDRDNDYDRIPRFSPASIHQGTLAAKIGDFAQVRSDTFRIRSYGVDLDSGGETERELYCEAVVQRIVDEVDPAGGPFGREFRVVSFRWISNPEENL
ncbi:MAG: hypothetical protein ACQKBT_10860 [Puniceicoccales bacterium]